MKSLKIAFIALLVIVILGCENRVEKAKNLWAQNKQSEAIANLNMEMSKNPNNIIAKKLLEQYKASIEMEQINGLWKAGNKLRAIGLLRNATNKYPHNNELNKFLSDNLESRASLKGEIVRWNSYPAYTKFRCIVPVDKTVLPLLTTNPSNSFAFVIFYREEELKHHLSPTSIEKNYIVLNKPRYQSGRASVKLSEVKGFNEYLKKLRNVSRYDIVDKMNEIISNILKAHNSYSSEYKKYLISIFEVYDSRKLDLEYDYDLANQILELDIIGPTLVEAFDATYRRNNYLDKVFIRNQQGYWVSKEINVQLPSKIAKNLAKGTKKKPSKLEYKYIIEPLPKVKRGTCNIVGICGWMPSFIIHRVVITLKNNEGHNIVSYKLENINENTVSYTPSFDNKKRQTAILK